MKKVFLLLLAFLLCLSLCACGSPKTPSEKLIEEDLTKVLSAKYEHAIIENHETVKSLTGEGTYEISLSVTAKSKYADWDFEVNMHYTKYDQGWKMDSAELVSDEYTVVSAPDTETFTAYATNYLKNHNAYSSSYYMDSMFPMEQLEITYADPSTLIVEWVGTEAFIHANKYVSYTSRWQYDGKIDNWTLVPDADDYYGYCLDDVDDELVPNFNLDFSGTWSIGYGPYTLDDTATISNFTWDSFDLNTTHETWDIKGHYEFKEDFSLYGQSFVGFVGPDGTYALFNFHESNTIIEINDRNKIVGQVKIECKLPDLT